MQRNPQVGLILIRSEWPDCPEARQVVEAIQADSRRIVERLSRHFDIQSPWEITTPKSIRACQQALRDADLDMVLLVYQTQADDARLPELLAAIGSRPLVFWGYQPWRRPPHEVTPSVFLRGAAPAGAFGALGILRDLNTPFFFTYGALDDPRLIVDLYCAGQAAALLRDLTQVRLGLIPGPKRNLASAAGEPERLSRDFGPDVLSIPVDAYREAVKNIEPARVQEYLGRMRECCEVRGVQENTLHVAARAVLGLEQVAADYKLDVLSIDNRSPELRQFLKLRPGLYPDLLEVSQTLYVPVNDLCSNLACLILRQLANAPTLLMEFWFVDQAMNQIIGGYSGLQNPAVTGPGRVVITPDTDLCRAPDNEGAQFELVAQPGRITIFQLRETPTGWQAIAASGVCLEDQPRVVGCPHAILRLDSPIDHFLHRVAEVGTGPYWALVHGSVLHEVEAFCEMKNIPLELIVD
jgi:hypothetical protein